MWTWSDIVRMWLGTEKIPLFQVLGNSSIESKAVDGMEEMELSEQDKDRHLSEAAEQGQDIIMCSPEKETSSAQSGEPQMHQTGAYLRAAWCSLGGIAGAFWLS